MDQTRQSGSSEAVIQASNASSSSGKRTVADDSSSMIERNPAPDSSPARAPAEVRTFTIRS